MESLAPNQLSSNDHDDEPIPEGSQVRVPRGTSFAPNVELLPAQDLGPTPPLPDVAVPGLSQPLSSPDHDQNATPSKSSVTAATIDSAGHTLPKLDPNPAP